MILGFFKSFQHGPTYGRLLLKLDHIRIRGDLLEWIRGFLLNGKQRVLCDGVTSDWDNVPLGVPQAGLNTGPPTVHHLRQ